MEMVESSRHIWFEVEKFEQSLTRNQPSDATLLYDEWIKRMIKRMNPTTRYKLFTGLDNMLFHTNALLLSSGFRQEDRDSIITLSRLFDSDINNISDLKKLSIEQKTFIATQQVASLRFSSMIQGGITGTGGYLLLGVDFPLMIIINLRVVQIIGLCFGHEVNHPFEMMVVLKLFHAATLPKRFQSIAWNQLNNELKNNQRFMYNGKDEFTNFEWLDLPMKQLLKALAIRISKRKVLQGLPLLSIGIGAYGNYQLTKNVSNFAIRFYQKRHYTQRELK